MSRGFRTNPYKKIAILTGIFLVYFLSGKLGLRLAYENVSATAVWAPTGIAIAAILLLGYSAFPAVLAGAFLINITTTGDIPTSLLIALGNTAEGALAVLLIRKYAGGVNVFASSSNIIRFVFFAGMLSTAVSATVGVTSLAAWGFVSWDSYISVWLTWWIGDAVGTFLVAPLIILWIKNDTLNDFRKPSVFETASAFAVLIVISFIEFTPLSAAAVKNYPLSFLLIPPFVWLSFRFDKRYVTGAAFIVSAIAIWGTLNGYGPFIGSTPNDSLVFLQSFICIITVMSLIFASIVKERNLTEYRLREAHAVMEEKVKERTKELKKAQADLIHSEKLASLGRFSAGVAHEIRNPLANISSLTQLLMHKNNDERITKYLESILVNSQIANNIISDLLTFASQDTNNLKETDISSLLDKVCNGIEARCIENRVRLHKYIGNGIPIISANEERLYTAFQNLITNSIESMPHGGNITITAECKNDTGEIAVIIRDTGCGISDENKSRILEPFFTTKPYGTGLGLSLVYSVIQSHSGKIEFESKLNQGTKFTVLLPSGSTPAETEKNNE